MLSEPVNSEKSDPPYCTLRYLCTLYTKVFVYAVH